MWNPFRRQRAPDPPPRLRLSDLCKDSPVDWQAGDIAICMDATPWLSFDTGRIEPGPAAREMNRVVIVRIEDGLQFLNFARYPGRTYTACSFEKLGRSTESLETMIPTRVPTPKALERV